MILKSTNKYDLILFLLTACLCFGNYGGALQVDRVLAILFSPWFVSRISKKGCKYCKGVLSAFILFYSYCIISFVWTPDKDEAIKELVYYPVHFLLFFEIIVFAHYANSALRSLSFGWMTAVFLTSFIAFWEITTGNHLMYAKEFNDSINIDGTILSHMYAAATFYNFNAFVTFLCFCLPWLLYRFHSKFSFLHSLLSFFSIAFLVIISLFNGSRGGLLAVAAMLFVYFIYSKKNALTWAFTLLLILGVVRFFILYGEQLFGVMIARASDGGLTDGSSRFEIWGNALLAFSDSYGFGVGIGGMTTAMAKYAHGGIAITHNLFLEILLQYGIVILLVFIFFLWKGFKKAMRITDINRKIALVAALAVMPIYGIINSGYLLDTHLYVLLATVFVFGNYERIKFTDKVLYQVA